MGNNLMYTGNGTTSFLTQESIQLQGYCLESCRKN